MIYEISSGIYFPQMKKEKLRKFRNNCFKWTKLYFHTGTIATAATQWTKITTPASATNPTAGNQSTNIET